MLNDRPTTIYLASSVQDLTHRQLLVAGQRQSLDFRSIRLMSRQLKAGSRVVAVLSVIKEPGREINYGTGKDVVDESIADATIPGIVAACYSACRLNSKGCT